MTTNENREKLDAAYSSKTHLFGRVLTGIVLLLLIIAPFVIGLMAGAMPDFGAVGRGLLSVGIVWIVSSVAEFLIYTPMVGSGGGYLAFITGNLINMKIPCAMDARDKAGVKAGTMENEIISTIAIAASSLTTILVIALGVLLLVPLRPILESPVLQPAFDTVVPALFGALAYKYYRKNIRLSLVPLCVMSLLFVLVPTLGGSVSFMIIPSGALSIALAWIAFKKGRKSSKR